MPLIVSYVVVVGMISGFFLFLYAVFEPPGVPTSVVVTENSMLDISCSTENSSRGLLTMVQWLDGNGNVVSGTAELSITPVSRFNAGLYSCVATSNMGSMQSNTTVIVQCKL